MHLTEPYRRRISPLPPGPSTLRHRPPSVHALLHSPTMSPLATRDAPSHNTSLIIGLASGLGGSVLICLIVAWYCYHGRSIPRSSSSHAQRTPNPPIDPSSAILASRANDYHVSIPIDMTRSMSQRAPHFTARRPSTLVRSHTTKARSSRAHEEDCAVCRQIRELQEEHEQRDLRLEVSTYVVNRRARFS